MNNTAKKRNQTENKAIIDVAAQLAELQQMTVGQLRERYLELYGTPTNTRNKKYLQKKLAYRVQELAEGGLSGKAMKRIDELAETAPIRHRQKGGEGSRPEAGGRRETTARESRLSKRDPRLPAVGEFLTKVYKDTEYQVQVLEDGFEFNGRHYKSLSRIARDITNTVWNGFLFFGLTDRGKVGGE
jgi:hypothetical protein